MVQFNELLITPDAKTLIIDVSIPSESYYDKVYLDSVLIDNQDTYVGTGVSSTPIYSYTVPTEQQLKYKKGTTEYKTKHLRLVVKSTDLPAGSLNGILFVYVRTKGTYGFDTPCGCDEITSLACVINLKPFYDLAMANINQLAADCAIPQGFINQILQLKALEVSVRTRNYPKAIKLWKEYNGSVAQVSTGGCGCHA